MLTNTTLPFDYEHNPTAAFRDALAASVVAAWFLGLLTFVNYYGNHRPAPPTPAQYIRPAVTNWEPLGVLDIDGRRETLYGRTYPSGKKAWRYQDDTSAWVYPRRSELDLSALR